MPTKKKTPKKYRCLVCGKEIAFAKGSNEIEALAHLSGVHGIIIEDDDPSWTKEERAADRALTEYLRSIQWSMVNE